MTSVILCFTLLLVAGSSPTMLLAAPDSNPHTDVALEVTLETPDFNWQSGLDKVDASLHIHNHCHKTEIINVFNQSRHQYQSCKPTEAAWMRCFEAYETCKKEEIERAVCCFLPDTGKVQEGDWFDDICDAYLLYCRTAVTLKRTIGKLCDPGITRADCATIMR